MQALSTPVNRNKETGIWTAEVNGKQTKQKIIFDVSVAHKAIFVGGLKVVQFDKNRNAEMFKIKFKSAFTMPMDDENVQLVFDDMIKKAKALIF